MKRDDWPRCCRRLTCQKPNQSCNQSFRCPIRWTWLVVIQRLGQFRICELWWLPLTHLTMINANESVSKFENYDKDKSDSNKALELTSNIDEAFPQSRPKVSSASGGPTHLGEKIFHNWNIKLVHTWYLSRAHERGSCKIFLAGVNFYRFNAKNWQFTVYFAVITQKIGNLLCILS